jgi:hypothetical protein
VSFSRHRTVHDELYRLAFIKQIFVGIHEFRLVHSASFERAMFSLTGLPLIDISDELVVLGLRFLVPLVQHTLFPLLVYLALLGEVVLRLNIPIPLVVNTEALLNKLEDFFLVIKLALLALGDAHATEESFVIRDFFSKELYLLELTLCKILLAGALAQGGHGKGARDGVVCELSPHCGFRRGT